MCTKFQVCIVFCLTRSCDTNKYINKYIHTYTSKIRNILDRLLASFGFLLLKISFCKKRKASNFSVKNSRNLRFVSHECLKRMSECVRVTLYNVIPKTIIPFELKTQNTHQKLALDKITKLVEYRNLVNF